MNPSTSTAASSTSTKTPGVEEMRRPTLSDGDILITATEIQKATDLMNSKGVDRPIKDGLELQDPVEEEIVEADIPTSDEEIEMPGTYRPRKGSGWWGRGSSLKAMRKGIPRDFVDGAGLCSPGRWKIGQRILPDDHASRRIKTTLRQGLDKAMKKLMSDKKDDKWDMKRLLMELAIGRHKESPFDTQIIDDIRVELRIICKQSGHGPGLPEEGDVVQAFEVRLIQGMMRVFGDPDEYMCHWWARGAWLGSPQRKLPRTPTVFDRKVRWAKIEPVDELHQGWQLNYPSLEEHANLVESPFSRKSGKA